MIEAWRIDSLDARAGIAFASWRTADLISGNIEPERAAVFIAPPYFLPEALSNRAMGLSASRGQAQLGVFVQENELAFETLDALSEFVRRVYQSSGGGDLPGGGGTGGRPRPPLEPEGGEPVIGEGRPEEHGGGVGGAQSLVDAAGALDKICSILKFKPGEMVQSKPTGPNEWREVSGGGAGTGPSEWGETEPCSGGADASLAVGATELLIELVRRFPLHGNHTKILLWCEGGTRLANAIARLGLWRDIMNGPAADLLDGACKKIIKTLWTEYEYVYEHKYRVAYRWVLTELLISSPPWVLLDEYPRNVVSAHSTNRGDTDTVDDLCAWPLPSYVTKLMGSTLSDRSAFHLLGTICASPTKLASGPLAVNAAAAGILLFSAAHLVVENPPAIGSMWDYTKLHQESLKAATGVSREWLMQQWPVMVFPRVVENIIGDAAKLAA